MKGPKLGRCYAVSKFESKGTLDAKTQYRAAIPLSPIKPMTE